MAKAFALTFPYTPRWKGNRSRVPEDQFTVTLRDLQESKRVAEQERLIAALGKAGTAEGDAKTDAIEQVIRLRKENLALVKDLVEKYLVSVDNLVIETPESDAPTVEIKTFAQLWEYCSDVVAEISGRLLNGPDADELKN